jgi:DNA-binding response OmpR family regulator
MRLLVAEDDAELRDVLSRGLSEAGYVVDTVADGQEALDFLRVYEYALCILDWRMPIVTGIDVVTTARQRGVQSPFLMLTARDSAADRIDALDEGADDYLTKPFDYGELLARVRALLRRPMGNRSPLLRCGSLVLDPSTRETFVDNDLIDVTAREFAILELLLRRSPTVVQRGSIAIQAWPDEADAVGSNTIDVHIARLRAKIARSDARIQTVRGAGYRLISTLT